MYVEKIVFITMLCWIMVYLICSQSTYTSHQTAGQTNWCLLVTWNIFYSCENLLLEAGLANFVPKKKMAGNCTNVSTSIYQYPRFKPYPSYPGV